MITIIVKTFFQGKVAMHEKYLKQAKAEKKGFQFVHYLRDGDVMKQQVMIIPHEQIETAIAYKNGFHKEKFGTGTYYLIYYKWNPIEEGQPSQEKLL